MTQRRLALVLLRTSRVNDESAAAMLKLAAKQILHEPAKTSLVVLAIAAVVATILVLRAFENGIYEQLRLFAEAKTPLIVAQKGVRNLMTDRSSLPQSARDTVEAVAGVQTAHPATVFPVIYRQGSRQNPIYLWVYDQAGGPRRLIGGRWPEGSREVVIDWSLAKTFDLKPGDPLVVSDYEFRIAGITETTTVFFTSIVFVTYDALIDFFLESDVIADISTFPLLSFLLVDVAPGASAEATRAAIGGAVPDVSAWTREEVAAADVSTGRGVFGSVMSLLTGVAYLIGILVIGLICFADVATRSRSFAVLKALGFRDRHLVATVAAQTLLTLLAAFPLGVVLAMAAGAWLETIAPRFMLPVLLPGALGQTLAASLVLAVAGSFLPVRSIARIEPAVAFRGG
jgi:putative ABC transport system permease protein